MDLKSAGLSAEDANGLRVSDFEFQHVPKEEKPTCLEIQKFIKRHEWLRKMPTRPTHRFIATYKGKLAGVIVMATPNSFSNLLGEDNRDLEKLISRGACISWSPKNLGSALVMFSIRWMVNHTSFRLFTAYSDIEARELGTIYQACNFTYLGQNSGARIELFNPNHPARGWFSDRLFRKHSQIRKYAKELGIVWDKDWSTHDKTQWEKIPGDIKEILKNQARAHRNRCESRRLPPKHKYAYILGRSKSETKKLKSIFENRNPKLAKLPYPKHRGPLPNTAAKNIPKQEEILTESPAAFRPQEVVKEFEFLNAKEASVMLGVSVWTIYKLITTDPNFPAHNIGVKKKWVVNRKDLINWMESKTKRRILEKQKLPSGEDLLKLGGE